MATWPTLLPRPSFDGYAIEPLDQAVRTDMESGSPRSRRRSKSLNDRINVTWRFTDREMAIFKAWHAYEGGSAGGSAWFDILLAYGDFGLRTREARFASVYKPTLSGGMLWTVTATLEIRGGELTVDQMRGAILGFLSADGVFPSLVLDFAADLALDSRITFTRASQATYFDAYGVMQTAATNVARFDHDPITHASLGLLIEPPRSNYIANADTTSAWATISTGTATGPQGSLAKKCVPNAGAVSFPSRGSLTLQTIFIPTTVGQVTSVSFTGYFASTGPLNYRVVPVFQADTSNTNFLYALCEFDPATGVISGKSLGTGWSDIKAPEAVLMPCGMWKFTWSLSFTQQASARNALRSYFQIRNESGAVSYTGDGVSGIQYDCMQFEEGESTTSYIPTTSGIVPRAEETVRISGAAFNQWYSQDASTFLFVGDVVTNDYDADVLFGVSGAAGGDSIYAQRGAANSAISLLVDVASSTLMADTPGTVLSRTPFKLSAAVGPNSGATSLNGSTPATDTALTLPLVDRLGIGSSPWSSSNWISGHISKLVYWPSRLSNDEIRSLASA